MTSTSRRSLLQHPCRNRKSCRRLSGVSPGTKRPSTSWRPPRPDRRVIGAAGAAGWPAWRFCSPEQKERDQERPATKAISPAPLVRFLQPRWWTRRAGMVWGPARAPRAPATSLGSWGLFAANHVNGGWAFLRSVLGWVVYGFDPGRGLRGQVHTTILRFRHSPSAICPLPIWRPRFRAFSGTACPPYDCCLRFRQRFFHVSPTKSHLCRMPCHKTTRTPCVTSKSHNSNVTAT